MARPITNSVFLNRRDDFINAWFSLACFLLISSGLRSQSLQWAKSLSGTSGETGYDITVDAGGNVLTCGNFVGAVDFDPGAGTFSLNAIGSFDIFLSKLDAAGNFVWAKKFGGSNPNGDEGKSVVTDASGNVYMTGRFSGSGDFDPGSAVTTLSASGTYDVFVLKLDASGNLVWVKSFGGSSSDTGNGIALDAAGNIFVAGTFAGTADFDPGASTYTLTSAGGDDAFVAKLDPSGNFLWAQRLGGTTIDRANGVAVDSYGNVLSVGSTHGGDFDPGTGVFTITSTSGSLDIFISKLNSAGNFVWAKKIGGSSTDGGNAITVDALNNVYTTGNYSGSSDFDPGPATYTLPTGGGVFISKLDSMGSFILAKSFNGTGNGIAVDAAGNIYTAGRFMSTTDFDPGAGSFTVTSLGIGDIFISKLDVTGNFISAKVIGSTADDNANSLALDAAGNVHTTGIYNAVADFDPDAGVFNMTPAGNNDCFILKLGALSSGVNTVFENYSISCYPNPSNGIVTIETNEELSRLHILNMFGQVVYEKVLSTSSETLNLQELSAGTYIIIVSGDKARSTHKIIIQK